MIGVVRGQGAQDFGLGLFHRLAKIACHHVNFVMFEGRRSIGEPGRVYMLCPNKTVADCRLHPLIHTLLDFTVAQDLEGCQRFAIFGSKLPQTGHMLSFGLTITVSLHLGHLEGLFKFCFSVFSKSGLLYVFDVCFLIFPQSVQPGSR